ncbi:MAG: GNAT family N-acetyltransferase [Planctomycetota bacterium]
MIRSTIAADVVDLLALAQATGLFETPEVEVLGQLLAEHFEAGGESADLWLTDDGEEGVGPVGVAYVSPEKMTDRTWNLLLLAVHPDRQKRGRGAALLRHVERELAERGGRLLLVETAGVDEFAYVRAFYRKHGLEQDAVIRDFYADGVDKVVFRKALVG